METHRQPQLHDAATGPRDDGRLTIVVAAYNEAEALPLLHPRIASASL